MITEDLAISLTGHVKITDTKTKEVLLDKKNAIHGQNMARMIARALSKEPNYNIYRLALGNGGTFSDVAGQIIFKSPNDGTGGEGFESRLYNETYSEIIDETDSLVGTNPIGGDDVANDPVGQSVKSIEVGTKSNVVITLYLNENEPQSQLASSSVESTSTVFRFDELGLYSPGKPPSATNGISSIDVGSKISTDIMPLAAGAYTMNIDIDGILLVSTILVPVSGSGSGGEITYGDFCEGLNTGNWVSSGNPINSLAYVFITDRSGGTYPSIIGRESYGLLSFQSKSTGVNSTVTLYCSNTANEIFNTITNGICGNVNINNTIGQSAGTANDSIDSENERERLLTHLIFNPILKAQDRGITIEYTITISVNSTQSSQIQIN